jgi:hypothetical protein
MPTMKFSPLLAVLFLTSLPGGQAAGPAHGAPWTIADPDLTLVPIASGSFTMGPGGAFGNPRLNLEFSPETRVTLTRPFCVGTEVTGIKNFHPTAGSAQWELTAVLLARLGGAGRVGPGPMYCVTWRGHEFCAGPPRASAAGRLPAPHLH